MDCGAEIIIIHGVPALKLDDSSNLFWRKLMVFDQHVVWVVGKNVVVDFFVTVLVVVVVRRSPKDSPKSRARVSAELLKQIHQMFLRYSGVIIGYHLPEMFVYIREVHHSNCPLAGITKSVFLG